MHVVVSLKVSLNLKGMEQSEESFNLKEENCMNIIYEYSSSNEGCTRGWWWRSGTR